MPYRRLQLDPVSASCRSCTLIARETVLGALLLEPRTWSQVSQLRATDFPTPASGAVFQAMEDLARRGEHCTLDAAAKQLELMAQLSAVGGRGYLGRLGRDMTFNEGVEPMSSICRQWHARPPRHSIHIHAPWPARRSPGDPAADCPGEGRRSGPKSMRRADRVHQVLQILTREGWLCPTGAGRSSPSSPGSDHMSYYKPVRLKCLESREVGGRGDKPAKPIADEELECRPSGAAPQVLLRQRVRPARLRKCTLNQCRRARGRPPCSSVPLVARVALPPTRRP